jgi:SAM-dependent methyltransferase
MDFSASRRGAGESKDFFSFEVKIPDTPAGDPEEKDDKITILRILMIPESEAWEDDYSRRGILWGGVTHDLPDLPVRSRVLELGCGNGKTLFTMIQRGWDVTAIDFACRAVTLSRQVVGGASHGNVMVADTRYPPFKNDSFDAVFAMHIISHMYEAERDQIARTLQHILKPGGALFFSDFSTDDFRFGKGCETEPATFRRGTGIITHYFTREEISNLFSQLTVVSISIHQWPLRILGSTLVRSEIQASFTK